MKSIRVLVLAVMLCAVSLPDAEARGAGRAQFELKRHELTVGTGICPGRYSFGYNHVNPFDHSSIQGAYDRARYYENEYLSGVWSLGYTYNFTKLFAVQTNIFYESGWINRYCRADGSFAARSVDSYFSAMGAFKVHWFNRAAVRMYSYMGVGISFNANSNDEIGHPGEAKVSHEIIPAFQFTPFGISFGKRFFGFAEVGIGHYFSGCALGAGYRF